MLSIGLTGGIGSGKSTVANCFAENGVTIVDADVIAQQLTTGSSHYRRVIVDHFGDAVLTPDSTLNRQLLRQLIFDNDAERRWLEALLHPAIVAQLQLEMARTQGHYCIAVVPLLVEAKLIALFDRILVVDTTVELQRQRILKRDSSDVTTVERMIQQQCSREQRLAVADDVIINKGDFAAVKQQVNALHVAYSKLI